MYGKGVDAYPMFKFQEIQDLPPMLRESAFQNLRRLAQQNESDMLLAKENKRKFNSILSKLQIELERENKDTEKITNFINELEIREEYKAKMLFMIDQGEWQNIFVIIAKINPYYTKKLLNPLQYLAFSSMHN